MYRIVDVQGIPLTKGAAQAHASLTGLPGERDIKESRLKWVQGLLDNGRFAGPSWARGRCLEDGCMYRFEGQHTSKKLSDPDVEIPPGLLIQMTTWEFDSLKEAADLFDIFNNPRSARTNEDMMGVYKAAVPGLGMFTRKFLIAVANGVHVRETEKWENGDETAIGPYPPRERGMYFHYDAPVTAAHWLARFKGMKNAFFLNQPVIVAEMLHEHEVNEALATAFWTIVFTEDGPNGEPLLAKHPAKVLADIYKDSLRKQHQRPPQWRAKATKAWKQFQTDPIRATVTEPDTTVEEFEADPSTDQPAV